MRYSFNPHRHVKIWLSTKEDEFLGVLNQYRLIQMRVKNPNDEISLVYAERLLSQAAQEDLLVFCDRLKIKPISVEKDIIPNCTTSITFKLAKCYHHEIDNLNSGGNVAAASDILRVLPEVYKAWYL